MSDSHDYSIVTLEFSLEDELASLSLILFSNLTVFFPVNMEMSGKYCCTPLTWCSLDRT